MKKMIVPIIALLFMGCDENELIPNVEPASAVEALTEYATINKVFQDIGNNTGDAILNAESSTTASKSSDAKTEPVGPDVTIEPLDFTTFPKTITVDYKSGVLCKDGITRKGIVTIVSTDWYGKEDSEHTATFTNYYHNDYKVEGTHLVKNLGLNEDENSVFSITIGNGKITTKEGASISYTENSTRTWVSGSNTPLNIWDDEYLLDGKQTGKSSKDINYALTVDESLHFVLLPRSIESGILDVEVASIKNVKLNYNDSTITIFGKSYPFGN
tara:strand:- start:10558 stop:11373 length:816 start_codon:yes stop_codon:yes gene_type:complete